MQGEIPRDRQVGVELGIKGLDTLQIESGHFHWGELFGGDTGPEFSSWHEGQISIRHGFLLGPRMTRIMQMVGVES